MTNERFHEYVEEFRAFSRFHKVGYGHPHDLLMLKYTLETSERFRVEMASMARAAFYREGGSLTQPEMLRIVAVAWAGAAGEEPAGMAMANTLSDFLREVLSRSPSEPQQIMVEPDPEIAAPAEQMPAQKLAVMRGASVRGEQSLEGVREDPWVEGSFLHRALMEFAQWRAAAEG